MRERTTPMTDDIAACPHSLAERETAVADGMCPICSADALSRLATQPLPKEIAELIAELEDKASWPGSPYEKAATAIRALAQENERLHERLEDNHEFQLIDGKMTRIEVAPGSIPDGIECRDETIKLQDERIDRQSARIRELEAERDQYKDDYLRRHKDVGDQMDRRIKAEAERDAIRKAERALSDAYVRLRVMIPGALDTPHASTSEQIWNITEKALSRYAAAIRAKTIEECADIAVTQPFYPDTKIGMR